MPVLDHPDPLLTLAVVVMAGVASGALARKVRLPGITGQIVVGVVMGSSVLNLFSHDAIERLQPLTHFALGLMAVTVGSHLSLRRLRGAGRRLAWLLAAESVVTPLLVFAGLSLLPGIRWTTALLLSALAVSTAPVTVLALVKETRAKGVFTKTLIAAVALNNIACIVLFEVARAVARWDLAPGAEHRLIEGLVSPVKQIALALALGGGAAFGLARVSRIVKRGDMHTTTSLAAILLTSGLSGYLGVSPLLSCLFLGMIVSVRRDRPSRA